MKTILSHFPNWHDTEFTISNPNGFNFYTATQAVLDEVIDLQNEALEDNGYVSSVKINIQLKEDNKKVSQEFAFTKIQTDQIEKIIFDFFAKQFTQKYNIKEIKLKINLVK